MIHGFNVGDRVIARGKNSSNTYTGVVIDTSCKDYIVVNQDVVNQDVGHSRWECKITPSGAATANGCWDGVSYLEHYGGEVISTKIENKMENIVTKFKVLTAKEPEKSFIKAGIMDVNFELTAGGKTLFNDFLLEKFKDEFKTEVVDKLIEEDKK